MISYLFDIAYSPGYGENHHISYQGGLESMEIGDLEPMDVATIDNDMSDMQGALSWDCATVTQLAGVLCRAFSVMLGLPYITSNVAVTKLEDGNFSNVTKEFLADISYGFAGSFEQGPFNHIPYSIVGTQGKVSVSRATRPWKFAGFAQDVFDQVPNKLTLTRAMAQADGLARRQQMAQFAYVIIDNKPTAKSSYKTTYSQLYKVNPGNVVRYGTRRP